MFISIPKQWRQSHSGDLYCGHTSPIAFLKLKGLIFFISSAYRLGKKILTPTSVAIWYGRVNCASNPYQYWPLKTKTSHGDRCFPLVVSYLLNGLVDQLLSMFCVSLSGLLEPQPTFVIDAKGRDPGV